MTFKNIVLCGECKKALGFRLGSEPMGSIYCHACETAVLAREEAREKDLEQYRHALNR